MYLLSKLLLPAFILAFATGAQAQANAKFDRHLADSLGADKYGMKTYVLVILKTGDGKAAAKHGRTASSWVTYRTSAGWPMRESW